MFSFARHGKNKPTSAKKHDSPIMIKKNASQHLPGKFTDRGLEKNHRVTPIEHFLLDIIQISVMD